MSALEANFFYQKGFDVTIIIDQSYSENLLTSKNAKMYNEGIKIIPALTSYKYLDTAPQIKRKAVRKKWFNGSKSEYYDEYGKLIKVTYLGVDKQRLKIEIPYAEAYLAKLKKGDVVIAMEASLGWYLGYLKLPEGVSKIFEHHNQHFFLSPWIDNAEKYDAIVFQTEKTKLVYERMYGIKNNSHIIGGILRIDIPKNISNHIDRPLKIVAVGHLAEGKQPLDSIKAFEIINQAIPNTYLEFYGDGNLKDEILKYLKDNNLEDRVKLKGFESDLYKIYNDASLMLFPTKRESFGLVILEAFAYGVPTVAYSTTFGVDDLIVDGGDGYITNQGDYKALAKKAIELLKNPQQRDIFVEKGRRKLENFTYDNIMEQYFNLIKEISKIKINELDLQINLIKRFDLPKKLFEYILKKNYSLSELIEINKYLDNAEAKIINGKAYINNDFLHDKYNIPKELCLLNEESDIISTIDYIKSKVISVIHKIKAFYCYFRG